MITSDFGERSDYGQPGNIVIFASLKLMSVFHQKRFPHLQVNKEVNKLQQLDKLHVSLYNCIKIPSFFIYIDPVIRDTIGWLANFNQMFLNSIFTERGLIGASNI